MAAALPWVLCPGTSRAWPCEVLPETCTSAPNRLQVLESDSVTLKEAPLPGVYAGCSLIFPLLLQLDALLIPLILFVVYKFSGALLPPTLLP